MDEVRPAGSPDADTRPAAPPDARTPTVGGKIGRFEVERAVGRGAMGVVYEARDPLLGRSVAIKTLRQWPSSEVRVRFAREAAALARLSHPNVVTIFEVHAGDLPFIVMELVEGMTLRDWLTDARRPLPQVLDVMLQVGRGLAAAHEAGLVHRDVKPSNVLLESTGRVLLMDFGIARDVTGEWSDSNPSMEIPTAAPVGGDTLTDAGSIVGTPAYMAPEQRRGKPVDPAADQYAFCMVLHEAVFGHRPSTTQDPRAGRALPRSPNVPGWLRRVLVRGLAPHPVDRWPNMPALLDALERGRRSQSRRRRLAVVLGVAGVSAIGALTAYRANPASTCEARGQEVYRIWDAETRGALRTNLHERGGADGPERWTRVAGQIDEYAAAWADARESSCLVSLEQQDVLVPGAFDRVDECLQGRLDELRRLTDTLSNATPEMLARTAGYRDSWLSPVARCLEPLEPAQARPTRTAERDRARAALDRTLDLERAGDLPGALAASQELVDAAEALGDGDWVSSAYLTRGSLHLQLGDPTVARDDLDRAFVAATADGDDEMATQTAATLIEALGALGRIDDALRWEARARALLSRYGGEGTHSHAEIEIHLGNMYRAAARPEAAIPHLRRAIEILGDQDTFMEGLQLRARLAAARGDAGFRTGAVEELRDVTERMSAIGSGAHILAEAQLDLGRLELAAGQLERARATLAAAHETAHTAHGPGSRLGKRIAELQARIPRDAETDQGRSSPSSENAAKVDGTSSDPSDGPKTTG